MPYITSMEQLNGFNKNILIQERALFLHMMCLFIYLFKLKCVFEKSVQDTPVPSGCENAE